MGSSQLLGGSGWISGVVNTEKKYLLKREALSKSESAVVEIVVNRAWNHVRVFKL